MYIVVNDPSIRYTGRWDINENSATATAPGSMIEIAYRGKNAVLHFDIDMNMNPYPHIWIIVDDGAKTETIVDKYLRIEAPKEGNHLIKIIYKSAVEIQHRWYAPLIGKIRFNGYEADAPSVLPEDNRKVIEFVGDSITEGVLIDAHYSYSVNGNGSFCDRTLQDDSTATYAYLTAKKLDMKPIIMGYGAVGATKGGCGSVPRACEAYPYNFQDSPINHEKRDVVVINHGANDMFADAKTYTMWYEKLLEVVRKHNPKTKLVVLSAFYGIHTKELEALVEKFNKENNDNVHFIDSSGWVPREPRHPLRDGHMLISEKLTEELKKII